MAHDVGVQAGFVFGTLLSALLNVSDIFNAPRYVFSASALLCALSNGAIWLCSDTIESALVFRFLTGIFLAGVYPAGMKIMAA